MKRMKVLLAAGLCAFGCLGAVEIRPGGVDVVVDGKAPPAVRFAAQELTNFLAQALGAAVPVVEKPSPERTAIVLGDNRWSREAGIAVDSKPRDTFFVKTAPNRVYLAGRDHPRQNPLVSPVFSRSLERATSFAVYAFLEDYAGVRFYFPGELGTVVPKKDKIVVPDVDRAVTPDFSVREWYSGKKAFWFGKTENDAEGERMKRLDWLRLRMGTKKIPLCHGTRNFKYVERFGKTHPEYFSLRSNGSRTIESAVGHSGHLCWTSPVVEEIYQDVKAALTGKKPSDRGIPLKSWGGNVDLENRIVDIMPQDGQPDCACENCQKAYRAGVSPVWLATKAIAERLTAEGVEGTVTQMCYGRVRKVPEYDLPPNILVQVAVHGQWSVGRPDKIAGERKQITDWMDKLGHKVWLWTYPGKHPSVGPDFDGIPQLSMHAWGKYYSDAADFIIGGFSESETDRFSFNYLNYYVYSRVCWDVKTDIDAVLDEHYRLMFGAAAPEMKELYTILETKWMTKLTGESKDTPIGPVAVVPSWKAIFTEIYPPSEVSRLDGIVAAALSKVGEDSLEARRIRLISDEFIGGIKAAAKAYRDRVAAVEGFRVSAGEAIPLRVFAQRGKKPDIDRPVETKVRTWTDEKAIYAAFTCEEPSMDRVVAKARPRDNGEIWADNSVEWYFCPTGERSVYYHIGVNSEGAIFDNKNNSLGTRGGSIDKEWGEGVTAAVEKGKGFWKCTIAVPFAAIGARPAGAVPSLFARNRVVDGIRGSALYVWGPASVSSFWNSENYGTVEYGKFDPVMRPFIRSWGRDLNPNRSPGTMFRGIHVEEGHCYSMKTVPSVDGSIRFLDASGGEYRRFRLSEHRRWIYPPPGATEVEVTLDSAAKLVFWEDFEPPRVPSPHPDPLGYCDVTADAPTDRFQREIDAAAEMGGGVVLVPPGIWHVRPLVLKSNVTLELADGAVLLASVYPGDYDPLPRRRAFVYAEDAQNVAICGAGTLDGRGYAFRETGDVSDGASQPQTLPKLMCFNRCRNVRLEGFTYRRGGAWGCHLCNCDGVTMRRVRCFNHINATNDGIDIESRNVLIEDCDIDADDDAIAVKAESDKSFSVTNIVIRNCRLASMAYPFKIGTGSYGDVRDILVENCEFPRTKMCHRFAWSKIVAGITNDISGICGIGVQCVDGGRLENVTVRNVNIEGYGVPFAVRLGRRHAPPEGKETYLRNVLIENVNAVAEGPTANSIVGSKGLEVENVMLRNVKVRLAGGATASNVAQVQPNEKGYPGPNMFRSILPASGLFVQDARGVKLENVDFSFASPDGRPIIVGPVVDKLGVN